MIARLEELGQLVIQHGLMLVTYIFTVLAFIHLLKLPIVRLVPTTIIAIEIAVSILGVPLVLLVNKLQRLLPTMIGALDGVLG